MAVGPTGALAELAGAGHGDRDTWQPLAAGRLGCSGGFFQPPPLPPPQPGAPRKPGREVARATPGDGAGAGGRISNPEARGAPIQPGDRKGG